MFDSIECRSTMCKSKVVNIDSNKDAVDADSVITLLYNSEWGHNFIAQTDAPDPDTGAVEIFFIKKP